MSVDDWSDDEFNEIVDMIGEDMHPIQIAKRVRKPVKEVHDFWRNVIADFDGDLLPPRVAAFRARQEAGVR